MQQLVLQYHDKITTSSMIVAEIFEKEHKNVLRAIQDSECSPEFRQLNFELSSYKTIQNKSLPMYFITKDGFMMLAMAFTGEKAAKFREVFIAAFNKMEKALFEAKTPKLIPTYQQRILNMPAKSCPDDKWCIFDQASEIMLLIEKEIGSVCEYDLADGSIGIHWAKYREGKEWAKMFGHYYHEFYDKRGNVQCKCYDYAELKYFKVWLKSVYKKQHLYNYLNNKFKKDPLMLPRVEAFKPKLIGAKKAA